MPSPMRGRWARRARMRWKRNAFSQLQLSVVFPPHQSLRDSERACSLPLEGKPCDGVRFSIVFCSACNRQVFLHFGRRGGNLPPAVRINSWALRSLRFRSDGIRPYGFSRFGELHGINRRDFERFSAVECFREPREPFYINFRKTIFLKHYVFWLPRLPELNK